MTDTGKQIQGAPGEPDDPVTLYTVPADTIFYCRNIRVTNKTTEAQAITLQLAGRSVLENTAFPQGGGVQDDATHVLVAGDTITAEATSVNIDILISGVEET